MTKLRRASVVWFSFIARVASCIFFISFLASFILGKGSSIAIPFPYNNVFLCVCRGCCFCLLLDYHGVSRLGLKEHGVLLSVPLFVQIVTPGESMCRS